MALFKDFHVAWKESESESCSVASYFLQPHGLYTVHGILQARILEWVAFPFPGDLPNPGIEPRSPTLQAGSLPAEPLGKPKNTGVGTLSLLQGIFLTQGLNPGLPHCRQTLYCLRHQGSSKIKVKFVQLCPSLCNPTDYTVQGILQARILEWVAFPFPGDLPNPGIEPGSPILQADSLPSEAP